jgi:hypothetical protein
MARLPLVLVHGYSDQGESFKPWRDLLVKKGYQVEDVSICNYQSLTNEVTIKDIAEGFDRALRQQAKLGATEPFDAIVHSTGMLVVRSWLATYAARRGRLKRLIGLAPATFGSPLAHKGRSLLGSVFKGNKQRGPDFLEAGDLILDGLELGSRFTWDLTHEDVLCEKPMYGKDKDTPYVFIFCGTEAYSGLRRFINEPGTDGTVRWAGCALNTVKFTIDLSREAAEQMPESERVEASVVESSGALEIPFWPVAGKNHGTIVSDPGATLVDLVYRALQVDTEETFENWKQYATTKTAGALAKVEEWQQFVIRARDERGDPISDYYIEFFTKARGKVQPLDVDFDVHPYAADKSLRCFHVNLTKLKGDYKQKQLDNLWIRLIASSGSQLVGYHGYGSERMTADLKEMQEEGVWDAQIKLPSLLGEDGLKFFYPFTTTFVEVILNRDPLPFGMVESNVCGFLKD